MNTFNPKPNFRNYPCPYCDAKIGEHCRDKQGLDIEISHISREPRYNQIVKDDEATLQFLTNMIWQGNG